MSEKNRAPLDTSWLFPDITIRNQVTPLNTFYQSGFANPSVLHSSLYIFLCPSGVSGGLEPILAQLWQIAGLHPGLVSGQSQMITIRSNLWNWQRITGQYGHVDNVGFNHLSLPRILIPHLFQDIRTINTSIVVEKNSFTVPAEVTLGGVWCVRTWALTSKIPIDTPKTMEKVCCPKREADPTTRGRTNSKLLRSGVPFLFLNHSYTRHNVRIVQYF